MEEECQSAPANEDVDQGHASEVIPDPLAQEGVQTHTHDDGMWDPMRSWNARPGNVSVAVNIKLAYPQDSSRTKLKAFERNDGF